MKEKAAGQAPTAPRGKGAALDAADVRSFEATGAEVSLSSPTLGDFWLVGSYTDQARTELSAAHAATLVASLGVFPEARVTAFEPRREPTITIQGGVPAMLAMESSSSPTAVLIPPPSTPLRNPHLSFSRVSRWDQCPLSYKLHYIEKLAAEPGVPLRFGKAFHWVLEQLLREVIDDERVGPLSEERAIELYREAWRREELSGFEVFEEGLALVKQFVHDEGVVDHQNILAVEKEFRLPVGRFTVLGYIDRVDWIDDDTIEVIDLKTNRQLFARHEVDMSLQLSLYHLAAQRLWPWAKNVRLTFRMLRHGVRQETTRSPGQLEGALAYVEMLGEQMERAEEFPARLNTNCVHCDHRRDCPAYAEGLRGKRELLCEDLSDLEAVAKEREEVARLTKILYARKDELEDVLKTHLKDKDQLVLGGVRYRMFQVTSLDHPLEPTLAVLGEATGLPREELMARLACVDKKALDAVLRDLGKRVDKPRVALVKAELEAHAVKHHSPRLWAKEVA